MDNGVTFAGAGKMDAGISKTGTEPPKSSGGSKDGGVTFAGDGLKDVQGCDTSTTQHDPSKHAIGGSGSGGVTFADGI